MAGARQVAAPTAATSATATGPAAVQRMVDDHGANVPAVARAKVAKRCCDSVVWNPMREGITRKFTIWEMMSLCYADAAVKDIWPRPMGGSFVDSTTSKWLCTSSAVCSALTGDVPGLPIVLDR